MHVLIPLSGLGKRFLEAGYSAPKPFIDVDGEPILKHLLRQFPLDWPVTFIANTIHEKDFEISKKLQALRPNSKVFLIEHESKGPVWAVLKAQELFGFLNPAEAYLVSYCDYTFSWDPYRFQTFVKQYACDGAVVCYTGFHPEYIRPTMYAYCKTEDSNRVVDIKEKGSFTSNRQNEFASCGLYYFGSGKILLENFQKLQSEGPKINGESYVSLVYKHLLESQLKVFVFEIPYFMQWGTPQDLQDYNYWSGIFKHPKWNGFRPALRKNWHFVMPMAGQGSRFSPLRKPVIQVGDNPMYKEAQRFLPQTEHRSFIARADMEAKVEAESKGSANILVLEKVTAGQAITTQLGLEKVKDSESVFVSSCDHGLFWDEEKLTALLAGDPDVIVFGQRNYPMADVTPKAFAYIKSTDGKKIDLVSVKVPISETPRRDYLLVGTFYFKSKQILNDLINELMQKDIRVNGEFYLDSVVNLAIEKRLKVNLFETLGYLCWGTPESLMEYNYWHNYFSGLERNEIMKECE